VKRKGKFTGVIDATNKARGGVRGFRLIMVYLLHEVAQTT
jgi:hypothetical protein